MKRLLIVVDYQIDFVNGALGFEDANLLESQIVSLIKEYEDKGDEVVFTKDLHDEDYLTSEEGKNLPIPHCIKGSGGEELFDKVRELSKNHLVFEKDSFGSSSLFKWLMDKDFREVDLCGLDASICVFANAIIAKTALPNAHIGVYSSACGSGDKEALLHAYKAMKRLQIEVK